MSTDEDEAYIIAWLQKAKSDGWSNPEVIVEAVQKDPTRLVLGLDYCDGCGRAVADLFLILGDFDEDDPKLAGAQHVSSEGFGETCDKCSSDTLLD